jgi:hypothetical protein
MSDWKNMWGDTVDIIANTGIQFMDFSFTQKDVKGFSSNLVELLSGDIQSLAKPDFDDEDQNDIFYTFSANEIIRLYQDKWFPIPFFSYGGAQKGVGPFNWTRVRFKKMEDDLYSLQLAIDTTINSDDAPTYQQPTKKDAEVAREFSFSSDFEKISLLLKDGCEDYVSFQYEDGTAWVSNWISNHYLGLRGSDLKKHPDSKLEAWGSFVAFIEFLNAVITFPKLKIKSSPYSEEASKSSPINVDLVLDIGNSRTCGLLIEIPQGEGQARLNMEAVSQLKLRDLSEPSIREYDGLFESRVEFADLNFGMDEISRASGRNNAFLWPSFVRFGPEAIRLVSQDKGNEAFSGLSSPKRYLWDNSLFEPKWRFHNWENQPRLPRSLGAMMQNLSSAGESLLQIREEERNQLRYSTRTSPATRAEFSKSSLYGFMIMEIIAQAFRQINDPEYRGSKENKTTPRFLRNVIITLPTATPKQEQSIVKSKVKGAIKLLWGRMATAGQVLSDTQPRINVEWDEASCSQVMYLYSEIMEKYSGEMGEFLNIYGRNRLFVSEDDGIKSEKDAKSIKIACVDIGGGTTDLMVTTFFQDDEFKLTPIQNFREGFRKAGDDLLCGIIEQLIIPKLRENLTEKNGLNTRLVDAVLMNCLAKSVAGRSAAKRHKQRQFTIKVLAPLALLVINAEFSSSKINSVGFFDLVDSSAADEVKSFIDDEVRAEFSNCDWSIKDFNFSFSETELRKIIKSCFQFIFENISEVIFHSDVDCVLLTGRPSRNNLITELFKSCCSTGPSRIISMSKYYTGPWYPFKSSKNTVGDPKSSVAVGAMIIALAGSRRLANFYMENNKFQMRPTDLYIGRYRNIGIIDENDVLFHPDQKEDVTANLKMTTDTFIGSRQVAIKRWTATPLYKLYFVNADEGSLPYEVTVEKSNAEDDALYERINILEALDGDGMDRTKNVKLKLHTLGSNDEYWLDSGAFEV